MKFIGMMRVRDEARWIDRCIRALLPLCEKVYVLDDHSVDGTGDIANAIDQVVLFNSPFDVADFSETRDKTWLLHQIARLEPDADYIVCVDGDEELEPQGPAKIIRTIEHRRCGAIHVRIIYMWDKEDQWRSDRIYENFHRPSVFRLDPAHLEYRSLYGPDTSLHCTNIPADLICESVTADIRLYHWGYFDRETRIKKFAYYTEKEKHNTEMLECEDHYRHMVIGDLFPADSKFRWGGPLKLEPLSSLDTRPKIVKPRPESRNR